MKTRIMKFVAIPLGIATSLSMPLTMVACEKKNKFTNTIIINSGVHVVKMDDAQIKLLAPFSVETLKTDAKEMGWKNQLWKNGFLCESVSQFLNFLVNLAEEYGFDANKTGFVVTDDMLNKSTEDLIKDLKNEFKPNLSDDQLLKLINSLKAVKPNSTVSPEAIKKANLTGGGQTFDDDNDLVRANLEINTLASGLANHQEFGTNKIATLQWYEGDAEVASFSANVSTDLGDKSITRIVHSPNLLDKFPKIADDANQENSLFIQKYAKPIRVLLENLMEQLAPMASMLGDSMFNLSPILAQSIQFLISHFETHDADGNSVYTLTTDFYDKLKVLNDKQIINWLAIKAMYVGFDDSFQQQYPKAMSDNWKDNLTGALAQNIAIGIKDPNQNAMSILTNMGGTSWAHTAQYLFNPTLSQQENEAANQ